MKNKLLYILGIFFIVMFAFSSCKMFGSKTEENKQEVTLTINNASSYRLNQVKWNEFNFETIDVGESEKRVINPEGFGFIYFSFVPQGSGGQSMYCRTSEALQVDYQNIVFTFTDNTIVIQQQNINNKDTLGNILLPSNAVLSVSLNNRTVEQNDLIKIDKTAINTKQIMSFSLTNVGSEELNFIGNSPIKLVGNDENSVSCFDIEQPQTSSLDVNETTTFDIVFLPEDSDTYSAYINIFTNDEDSPFEFMITGSGSMPYPELAVKVDGSEILNEGTIDFGEVIIEKDKTIEVTIENNGTEKLILTDSSPVSFLQETESFEILSQPIPEISAGSSSTFSIKYVPQNEGEVSAVLKIASNDVEKENMYIYIKGNGRKVYPDFYLTRDISDGDSLPETITRKDTPCTYKVSIRNTSSEVDLRFDVSLENPSDHISLSCNKNILKPEELGTITITFDPKDTIGIYKEKIIISSNCEDQVFEFYTNFKSRELSTEAYLLSMDIGGTLDTKIIEPEKYQYTLTCDSDFDIYTVHTYELKYSENATVYVNNQLLESSVTVPIIVNGTLTIKVVSEDGENENEYKFTMLTKDDYDSTDITGLYLKYDGKEYDITSYYSQGSYNLFVPYAGREIQIKVVLKNPKGKAFIEKKDWKVELKSGVYSQSIFMEQYEFCVLQVLSESGLWYSEMFIED